MTPNALSPTAPSGGDRLQSHFEEVINTVSSLVGLALVLLISPTIIKAGGSSGAFGAWTFCLAAALVYIASTLYHAIPRGVWKSRARLLDRSAIFMLIAATYTPFALGPLVNRGGWWLLGLQWGLAAAGIIFVLLGGQRYKTLSNVLYIGMGWMGLFWAPAVIQEASWAAFFWMAGGGLVYTIGVGFYSARKLQFGHFIWHLFVIAGTLCHAWAVWRFAFSG